MHSIHDPGVSVVLLTRALPGSGQQRHVCCALRVLTCETALHDPLKKKILANICAGHGCGSAPIGGVSDALTSTAAQHQEQTLSVSHSEVTESSRRSRHSCRYANIAANSAVR